MITLDYILYIVLTILIVYIFMFKCITILNYSYVFLSIFILVSIIVFVFLKTLKIRNSLLIGFSGIKPIFLEVRPTLLLVTGASSTGKTRFIQRIIKKLSSKIDTYIFDWYDEYHVLELPRHEVNLSTITFPIGREKEIIETRDLLSTTLNLTAQQANLLLRVLKALNGNGLVKVSIPDIKRMIEQLATNYEDKLEIETQQILLKKFESLTIEEKSLIHSIDPGIFVIVGGELEKRIGYALILRGLLQKFSRENFFKRKCKIIVIEEVHNLIPVEDTMFAKWIFELQKYGAMVIMIAPSASLVNKAIKMRTPIWISFATAPGDTSIVPLKLGDEEAIIRKAEKIIKVRPLFFKIKEEKQLKTKEECSIAAMINNKIEQVFMDGKNNNYMIITTNNEIYSLSSKDTSISPNIYKMMDDKWLIDRIDLNTVKISGPNITTYLPLTIESIAKLEEMKVPEKVIDEFLTILAKENY